MIESNIIKDIPGWEGIDVHAGKKITVRGNTIFNSKFGIVGQTADSISCLELMIANNIIDSGSTDGDVSQAGIELIGNVLEQATGTIEGNIIIDCGFESNQSGTGIFMWFTDGVAVTGNHIIRPSRSGMELIAENKGFNITGNTIIDPWTDATGGGVTFSPAISIRGEGNTGYSGGNTFLNTGDKSATFVLSYSYNIEDFATQYVVLGEDYSQASVGRFFQDRRLQVHHGGKTLQIMADILVYEGEVLTYENDVLILL